MTQENKQTLAFVGDNLEIIKDIRTPTVSNKFDIGKNLDITITSYGNINLEEHNAIVDVVKSAPEMLVEMEKLAQALDDTGFEPEQSFYDVIKKARGE